MTISAIEASKLNQDNPEFEKMQFGTEIKAIQDNAMVVVRAAVAADATSGLSITIPVDMYITDVIVQCTAANASGTLTLRNSTTAITDAIACATNHAIDRAATIDDAQASIATTDSINVIANGAADRGVVYIIGMRS